MRSLLVARANGTVLHIAVYGGSALMLASNFRFAYFPHSAAEPDKQLFRHLLKVDGAADAPQYPVRSL